ncbi:cupin domain-containing protein [Natronobeatus ordinarius]|uniref:cupin domain-containing protein n=1 Tax=Natronobeatus ordinarius TaxID=2963433 RepID=UPI0020CEA2C8|nr:hypothetical protein [Natronobeatus ordinarius]
MTSGYASVSIDAVEVPGDGEPLGHRSFTDELGCSTTTVDGYRVPAGGTVPLSGAPEQLCLPIDADGPISLEGVDVPPSGVARLPAGVEGTLSCSGPTAVVVIGAPVESTAADDPIAVDLEACDYAPPSTSSIETARLTARLGCAGVKVNARLLDPGDHVPYHTEGEQEELFVPVRGPATMRIDDDSFETPVGTITRVAPPVPRSAVNDGDREACWVMIGAPPTGGPSEWDPGAEILE